MDGMGSSLRGVIMDQDRFVSGLTSDLGHGG